MYTPIIREALGAALHSEGHALRRARGGYAGGSKTATRSGTTRPQVFTRRAVNWLHREGLAEFDDPDFPTTVTLNAAGLEAAREIEAERRGAKAGAA